MSNSCLRHASAALGAGLIVLTACQSPADAAPGHLAWAHTQASSLCPLLEPAPEQEAPAPVVLDDLSSWEKSVHGAPADVLGFKPDWSRQRVVLFSAGPKPTGGWKVQPVPAHGSSDQAPGWALHQGRLQAEVQVQAPAPDAMVTQAFTSPCLWVVLPRAGWQSVVVRTRP